MSNHYGPEGLAPDEVRCEALVRGHKGWNWQWCKVDHRCPKRANQMRGAFSVCHIHARAKKVECYHENFAPQHENIP